MWRDLILLLPLLAAIAGWTVEFLGVNVRFDQALSAILTILLLISAIAGKVKLRTTRIDKFVYLLIFTNLVSSLLASNPTSSLIQLVNISSSISLYFVVLNLVQSRRQYDRFVMTMLAAGFAAMAYGLGLFTLGLAGFDVGGVNLEESVAGFGIYGSMREPNIFGSYSASMFLIGATLYLMESSIAQNRRRLLLAFTITAALALLFSYARGAWLGASIGLLALALHRKQGVFILSPRVLSIVLVVIVIAAIVFSLGVVPSTLYTYKLENLFNFEEGTGLYRALIWVKGWANFLDHPVFGNGTFSYSYLNPEDILFEGPGGAAWISNVFLLVLHDTGIVGMAVFLGFLWAVFRESRLTAREGGDQRLKTHAIAFKVAFLGLLVAFQATSAFYYGYTWILIGLIAAAQNLSKEDLNCAPDTGNHIRCA